MTEKELNSIENQWGIPDGLPIETKKNWLPSGPLGNPTEINLKSWKYNNLGVNGLKKISGHMISAKTNLDKVNTQYTLFKITSPKGNSVESWTSRQYYVYMINEIHQ